MAQTHVPVSLAITFDRDALADICHQYCVQELALFGSVLRADFGPHSDVDVLVTFLPGTALTLLWLGGLTAELESLFGRTVDLVHRPALRAFLEAEILSTKEAIYVQTSLSHELGLPQRHRRRPG